MTAPTIYTFDDPDGPGYQVHVLHWLRILKACLVDGYPGKPAAGWSLVYDDIDIDNADETVLDTRAIFKSASGNTILMIEPVSETVWDAFWRVYLCEQAFSDGSVTGAVSGDQHDNNPGGTPVQFRASRSTFINWIIAATPETVFFNTRNTDLTYAHASNASWNTSFAMYCGRFKNPNPNAPEKARVMLMAGKRTTATSSGAHSAFDSTIFITVLRGFDGTPLMDSYNTMYAYPGHPRAFRGAGPAYQFQDLFLGMADAYQQTQGGFTYTTSAMNLLGSPYGLKNMVFQEFGNGGREVLLAHDPSLENELCFTTPANINGVDYYRIESAFGYLLTTDPAAWSD